MKLQFDPNQDYQLDAINAVVDIFAGQRKEQGSFEVQQRLIELENGVQQDMFVDGTAVKANQLMISDEQLVKNVHEIQERNGLEKSNVESGCSIPFELPLETTSTLSDGMHFTIEMETGTGKTYVYLRTIHKLHADYGFKKFIIVVPSIAIREGVLKNIEVTKEHFASLFGNIRVNTDEWNARSKNQAKNFAESDVLEILVINIDSFAKDQNIIRKNSDYGVPLEYIKSTNPIVIVDEPQKMESARRKKAIADLNPLCTLRYSATHKYTHNLMYKLDPKDAYNLGLVKKIEIDSVTTEESYNTAYIKFVKTEKRKKDVYAVIEIDVADKSGLQSKMLRVESGDDLEQLTGREIYRGYIVDELDIGEKKLTFTNGKSFIAGKTDDKLQGEIAKYQISRAIENHLDKELDLLGQNIKALTLFFVDRVANYREYSDEGAEKGKWALWFEQEYERLSSLPKYEALHKLVASEVHDGYFSEDRAHDSGRKKMEISTQEKRDTLTYELIMKNKERLLSEEEPVRFVFSYSALQEGWDNPNVFQICMLRDIGQDIDRRQTIGRGLRLPVRAEGSEFVRVRDERVNVLTVIANESYELFAKNLQTEMSEAGVAFDPAQVVRKSDRKVVKPNKGITLNADFKALWDKIKYKTRYRVSFDNDELVSEVVKKLSDDPLMVQPPKIASRRARLVMGEDGVSTTEEVMAPKKKLLNEKFPIPDVVGRISTATDITRQNVLDIIEHACLYRDILTNPQQFIDEMIEVINLAMKELQLDGIKYEKTGEAWDMKQFENEELHDYLYDEAKNRGLVEVDNNTKTTHSFVLVDSRIERNYAQALDKNADIKFYCKLPSWFKIDTPLGTYNPDWAIVFEADEKVYFVSETKGIKKMGDLNLPESQKLKIRMGRKHFDELGVELVGPTDSLAHTLEVIE